MSDALIAKAKPHLAHITWHWTAGSWTQTFDHYHFCVTFSEKTRSASVKQTLSLLQKGSHVWKRNAGNIGISLCGMGRIKGKLQQVQPVQVEACAKLTAELCHIFDLDLTNCHDHVYWANLDGYGPGSGNPETRIDIGELEPVVRRKAAWYLQALREGRTERQYTLRLT